MNYKEIVEKIINVGDKLTSEFIEYSKCYLLTTENIKDYLSLFDLNNKNVLTVCGSGDQALSALANGASSVTCFDINHLTKCLLELKKTLIMSIDIDDYYKFFDSKSAKFLDKEIYLKVSNKLNQDIKMYYDFLFNKFNKEDIFKKIFYNYSRDISKMKDLIPYFDETKYYYLAEILKEKNIEFVQSDIFNIINWIDKKYDVFLFSNITDYIISNKEDLIKYRLFIENLKDYLNDYGIIQIGYMYNILSDANTYFSYKQNRDMIFSSDKNSIFMTNRFKGYDNDDTIDAGFTLLNCKRK